MLAAVAVLAVGSTFAFFTRDIRFKRALRRLPSVAVGAVREGHRVKLVGRVMTAGQELVAPATQKPCVYYHAWHEVLRVVLIQGARTEEWAPAGEEEDACDFQVADDSGIAIVRIGDGRPMAVMRAEAYTVVRSDDGRHRSHEAVLQEGAWVAVVGVAHREIDSAVGASSYRDAPARVVVQAGNDPLVITDDPTVAGPVTRI